MSRHIIHTAKAPAALGPYSQAVRHGDLVFLSGQVAIDPAISAPSGGVSACQVWPPSRERPSQLAWTCSRFDAARDAEAEA